MMNKMTSIFIAILFLLFVFSSIVNAKDNNSPEDMTVDSILGALADMTVDEAKKVINLRYTRQFREKVCGLHSYQAKVSNTNDNHIRHLFTKTCTYAESKIERNIFSEELIEAFKKDMIINGVLLVRQEKNFSALLERRKKMTVNPKNFNNESLAISIIYLIWNKASAQEIVQQAILESDHYNKYVHFLKEAISLANGMKNMKQVVKGSIKLGKTPANTLALNYYTLQKDSGLLKTHTVELKQTIPTDSSIDFEMASLLLSIASSNDNDTLKKYSRTLLIELLTQQCSSNCSKFIKSINQLIDNRPKDIFMALLSVLKNVPSGDDIDKQSLPEYSYQAIGTLKTLSELTKVQDKESARAILDKYLADENTRTARYWLHSLTLGTLFGAGIGRTNCRECEDTDLPLNLFMPFGLFYTKGWGGALLHLADLGQYTSYKQKNNADSEESTKWRDAIAPGISFFIRKRKYPLSAGIDLTYKTANGINTRSESQIRAFIAMDIQLFTLN